MSNDNNDEINLEAVLLLDDEATATKESLVIVDESDPKKCLNCGFDMIEIQACHLQCPNCGATQDCSDKGLTW